MSKLNLLTVTVFLAWILCIIVVVTRSFKTESLDYYSLIPLVIFTLIIYKYRKRELI